MHSETYKIFGIILFVFVLIYLAIQHLKFQTKVMEGMTNNDTINKMISDNLGSNAQSYADKISKSFNSLKDSLLVVQNKEAYENIVINFDDYLSTLMIQNMLKMDQSNINEDSAMEVIEKINKLATGKQSLNTLIKAIHIISK